MAALTPLSAKLDHRTHGTWTILVRWNFAAVTAAAIPVQAELRCIRLHYASFREGRYMSRHEVSIHSYPA